MTIKTKTRRSWRRAGRCLGLILGLMWLAGCTTVPEAPRGISYDEFQEKMKVLRVNQQEAIKLNEECDRQVRIGMTASQVVALKACKNHLHDGQLMSWNTLVTAAGRSNQVRWGEGYLYFENYVLVAIQR